MHARKRKLHCLKMRVQHKQSGIKGAVTLPCCVCTSGSLGVAISLPEGNAGRHDLRFTAKRGRSRRRGAVKMESDKCLLEERARDCVPSFPQLSVYTVETQIDVFILVKTQLG